MASDPAIRRAQPGDAGALATFAAATFPLACPPHTSPADIDRHIARELSESTFTVDLADPAYRFFLAEDATGTVVGYLMLVPGQPPPDGPGGRLPMELRRIYVAAEHHGSPVAAQIVAVAVTVAADGGHDVLWLGTNRHNERALRFYRKQGFRISGTKTFRVGDSWEDDYVLTRPVVSTAAPRASAAT